MFGTVGTGNETRLIDWQDILRNKLSACHAFPFLRSDAQSENNLGHGIPVGGA